MAEIGTPVALGQPRPTHHCERIRVRCRRARQGLTHRFRRADAIGGEDDRRVPAAARRRPSLPPMTRRRSADRTLRCRVLPPARRLRQTSPFRTPKDVNHGPHGLSPAKRRVLGSAGRGHHRLCRTPKASQPQTVGEGHAPVVAVLVSAARQTLGEGPGCRPGPHSLVTICSRGNCVVPGRSTSRSSSRRCRGPRPRFLRLSRCSPRRAERGRRWLRFVGCWWCSRAGPGSLKPRTAAPMEWR